MQEESIQITEDALNEFADIWQSEHPGQQLPPKEELRNYAQRVLRAIQLTYIPIPAEKESLFHKL